MNVRVQMFAVARQLSGQDHVELDLAPGAVVRDLRKALAAAVPAMESLMPHLMFAINTEYVGDQAVIPPDAEIACIPPVSGG